MRGLFIGGTIAGIIIGLLLGLAISWTIWPITYSDADPADLRLDNKDDYLRMIAAEYSQNGDMARALARMNALRLTQPSLAISNLVAHENAPRLRQALIHLGLDLNQPAALLARPTFTPQPKSTATTPLQPLTRNIEPSSAKAASTFTATPPSTITVTPEPPIVPPTAEPNPNAPHFQLKDKVALTCGDTGARARIEVQVEDMDGRGMPGIAVEVNWSAGDDIFFTGLKPERGIGFADFAAEPGNYNVRLTANAQSDVIKDLNVDEQPAECKNEAGPVRGWKLVFAP